MRKLLMLMCSFSLIACQMAAQTPNGSQTIENKAVLPAPISTGGDFSVLSVCQTSRSWTCPVSSYPSRNGYLGWLGINSAFSGKHTAVDLGTSVGADVRAVADGFIRHSRGDVGSYGGEGIPGGGLVIEHKTADGKTFHAVYAHLQNRTGKAVGERVTAGEKIGEVGHYYVRRNGKTLDWPHLHFGIFTGSASNPWQGYASDSVIQNAGWTNPVSYLDNHSPAQQQTQSNAVNRAKAVEDVLKALNIPANMRAFNTSLFGNPIQTPGDVTPSTPAYASIVTAYNRGILSSSTFRPNDVINRAELVTLLVRAMPLLEYPELYQAMSYTDIGNEWYRSAVQRTYSAGVLPDSWKGSRFDAGKSVSPQELQEILHKASEFQRGNRSGINIYLDWSQAYADLDIYILDESVPLKHDSDFLVTNLQEIRNHSGTVYWNRTQSSWGAALDYDSWAGQGSQPVHTSNGERVSVDPRKVKRPGKYRVLVHYYDWNNSQGQNSVDFSWHGFHGGKNINTTGTPFQERLSRGQAKFVGQLNVN